MKVLYFTVRMGKKNSGPGKTQELVISFLETKRNFNRNILGSPNALYCVHFVSEIESIDFSKNTKPMKRERSDQPFLTVRRLKTEHRFSFTLEDSLHFSV